METGLQFFLTFLGAIVVTRIFLYFNPRSSPTIKGFRLHHYMFGIFIALTGGIIQNIFVYAIGLGLFVDEIGYLIIGGKTHEDNYSVTSILILVLLVVFAFILRNQILFWAG